MPYIVYCLVVYAGQERGTDAKAQECEYGTGKSTHGSQQTGRLVPVCVIVCAVVSLFVESQFLNMLKLEVGPRNVI